MTDLALEKMIELLAEDSVTTTLLAVDDSKTMRKVLEITFAGEEYNTVVASTPAEAMQHVTQQKPALALVDHKLADASGYDLCQQIKTAAPATRVIILSSKQTPYDRGKGTAVGADDFMDKPFDSQKMIDKVKAVLSQPATAAAPAAPQPAAPQRPIPGQRPAAPSPGGAAPVRPRPQIGVGPSAATPRPAGGAVPRVGSLQPRSAGASPARPVPNPAPAAARPAPSPAAPSPPAPARPAAAAALAAATSSNGDLAGKLQGLGLDAQQVQAVLSLSREVVEQVVWEVVPVLAEALIKEEIQRLTSE